MLQLKDTFPYWKYIAVIDSRTRDSHRALHHKIFKATDTRFHPPIGFNCRCTAIPLTQEEAHQEISQKPTSIKTPHASSLPNSEFVGNKQLNFIRWLKNEYTHLEPQSQALINKAIQQLTLSHESAIKQVAKLKFVGKSFETHDKNKINIYNSDIKTILYKNHENKVEKDNLVKKLDILIAKSKLVKTAPEIKGRRQYKKWFYYKYKEGFYLNVVEMANGEFKIHAITNHIK